MGGRGTGTPVRISGFNLGVTYEFTEPMDIRVSPTIAMKVGDDPLPEGTLAYSTGYWATSRTYYGFYVLDAAPDTYVPSVDVEVSGAVDATGQLQTPCTKPDVFTIDTSAAGPASVVGVTRSTVVIRDADAGSATFSLTIQYDADMDTASTPTIDYDADTLDDKTVVEGVVTPDAASHWMENDDTRYVAVFDVADVGEYVGWTNVTVAGALDAAHDHRQYRFEGSGFRIDMVLPADLAASGASTDEIDLTWNRYSPNVEDYHVQWSPDGVTDWTPLTSPDPAVNAAGPEQAYVDSDTTMTEGTTRYYEVKGLSTNGDSPWSDPVAGTTLLNAPDDVSANAVSGHEVDVSWSDNSALETGYSIQEDFGDGDWEEVAWVPAAANSGTMEAAVDGTFAPLDLLRLPRGRLLRRQPVAPLGGIHRHHRLVRLARRPERAGGDAQYQQPGSPFDLDRGHRGGTLYCRQPRRILGRGVGYRAPR